jgi:hypothetical protein
MQPSTHGGRLVISLTVFWKITAWINVFEMMKNERCDRRVSDSTSIRAFAAACVHAAVSFFELPNAALCTLARQLHVTSFKLYFGVISLHANSEKMCA